MGTGGVAAARPPDEGASAEQLRQQLAAATQAAREAYRHTTGLIRVLTVLGRPSSPEALMTDTLTVLSEVFSADVTCVTRRADDRLLVRAACGLPEHDPAFLIGWQVPPATMPRYAEIGRADESAGPDEDLSEPFITLGARSVAWVPFGEDGIGSEDLLVLYRHDPEPFARADIEVLRSVAHRLRLSVEARERSEAIERLATSGHVLTRHLTLSPLLEEAVGLLRDLTQAHTAWVATVTADAEGLTATVAASSGTGSEATHPLPPPRPAQLLPGWATMVRGQPFVDNRPDAAGSLPAHALIGIPIMGDTLPQALLYATRDRTHPFHRNTVDLAVIFANYLGVAMTNAELHWALVRSEASLRELATHDPLTGLANRVLANQRLEEALGRAAHDHVGLLFCDLDLFKTVNDKFGHEAGDLLLQQVSGRLRTGIRADDLLARIGGDEFVVVLDGVSGLREIGEIGRRLLLTLEEPFIVAGQPVTVTASVGGVLGERLRTSGSAMLRDADAAMFIAKDRGPGQIEVLPTA